MEQILSVEGKGCFEDVPFHSIASVMSIKSVEFQGWTKGEM